MAFWACKVPLFVWETPLKNLKWMFFSVVTWNSKMVSLLWRDFFLRALQSKQMWKQAMQAAAGHFLVGWLLVMGLFCHF